MWTKDRQELCPTSNFMHLGVHFEFLVLGPIKVKCSEVKCSEAHLMSLD